MGKRKDRALRRWFLLAGGILTLCGIATVLWEICRPKLELPYLTASSVAVLNLKNGQFIYEKDADIPRPPASLTKLMSLLLVIDDISAGVLDWEETCTVTEEEAHTAGSKYGMRPGEIFTVRQLTAGAVMSSGCDCILCLVRLCAGSEEAFVQRMNAEAEAIGLEGSHFSNATGIDAIDHYMTARDIARLSQELLQRHPEILDFTASSACTIGTRTFQNTNRLAGTDSRVTGLKTGTSEMGGCNLAVCAGREGEQYVIVLLDSNNDNSRYSEAVMILDALLGGEAA